MTIQDLKTNRDLIIKTIKLQSSDSSSVSGVMNKMLVWLNSREDFKIMKATKQNVKSFTSKATLSWIKNDYKPVITQDWLEKREVSKWASRMWRPVRWCVRPIMPTNNFMEVTRVSSHDALTGHARSLSRCFVYPVCICSA